MVNQGEALQQTAQGEGENEQLENTFQLDLESHLHGVRSDESEPNTGSTIYDPAIIASSPAVQAMVEERQKRDPFRGSKVDENGVFHISSPAARKTGETLIGEPKIRPPQEAEEEGEKEQRERDLCCHGLLPLLPSIIALNVMNMVIGFVCIGIAVSQLYNGNKDVVGFGSAGRLVISGSFLLALSSIVLGSLFILCGILGTLANYAKAYRSPRSGKFQDLVYHCLLFLVTLICVIIFGLNVYSVTVRQSGPIYDAELWKEFVRSDSRHVCNLENELNCAGIGLGQCLSDNNETRHTFCPGHFCVDFCRIATDDVSLQPICASCRKDSLKSIASFIECKSLEKERSTVQTCAGLPDEELDTIYGKLMAIAVIGVAWILFVWTVIAYVECFL